MTVEQVLEEHLTTRVDEVLFYVWDPIGVAGAGPSARDEYASYVPTLTALLKNDCSAPELADALVEIEQNRMGLPGSADRARHVGETLIAYRDAAYETRTRQLLEP